jgi:competence protein ComEC
LFKRHPLLLALICLVGGITAAGFLELTKNQAYWTTAITSAVLIMLLIYNSTRKAIVFGILFFTLGFCITAFQNERFDQRHFSHFKPTKNYYLAELINSPTRTKKALRFEVRLIKVGAYNAKAISGKIFLYTPPDSALEQTLPGDDFLFRARLIPTSPPLNPFEFDYQNYLHLHQIYGQTFTTDVKVLPSNKNSLRRFMAKLRSQLFGYISAMHLPPEEEAVAAALLLGYRHLLSDETQQAFSGAGAMHVLAVSGLHVGILYMITAFLLQMDKKKAHRNAWPKVLAALLIIWIYAALTGLSPSISRAAVMFSFIAIGNLFWRKPAIIQMIITSAICLLIYSPNYLFEVGFQLSYSAVFAIVYLQPKIYRLIEKPNNWLADRTWQITSVSIAAQAGTFPLSLYYFHQFPVFFMISNLVVIPLAYILMNFGIFLLLLSSLVTPPAFAIAIFQFLLEVMTSSVHLVETLPNAVISGLHIGRIEMALLTLLVYFVAEAIWIKKNWALFSSAGLAITLLGSFSTDAFFRHDKVEITLYSIPNKTAIEIRKGNQTALIADPDLLADEDAMLFYIRHNLWAEKVQKVVEYAVSSDTTSNLHQQKNRLIDAFGTRILALETAQDSAKFSLNPNYILVKKGIKPPAFVPAEAYIILMNGHNRKTKKLWSNLQNEVYDLYEKGAKVIPLQPF